MNRVVPVSDLTPTGFDLHLAFTSRVAGSRGEEILNNPDMTLVLSHSRNGIISANCLEHAYVSGPTIIFVLGCWGVCV